MTPEGLKAVFKDFNSSGDDLVATAAHLQGARRPRARDRLSSVCPPTGAETFDATAELAKTADMTFAQFVMMTPFPGHGRFRPVGEDPGRTVEPQVDGVPITRYWLIPGSTRPKHVHRRTRP